MLPNMQECPPLWQPPLVCVCRVTGKGENSVHRRRLARRRLTRSETVQATHMLNFGLEFPRLWSCVVFACCAVVQSAFWSARIESLCANEGQHIVGPRRCQLL